jgi:hypothetical protein
VLIEAFVYKNPFDEEEMKKQEIIQKEKEKKEKESVSVLFILQLLFLIPLFLFSIRTPNPRLRVVERIWHMA